MIKKIKVELDESVYHITIKVTFNTKSERRPGGRLFHSIQVFSDIGVNNIIEVEDQELVEKIKSIEEDAINHVNLYHKHEAKGDPRLLELGFTNE